MANAFVEYFNNAGRIMRERGAWYRIITFCIISIFGLLAPVISLLDIARSVAMFVANRFYPEKVAEISSVPINVHFNFPLLLLSFLCFTLMIGYALQLYSNRMNKTEHIIPKIDFLQMFLNGLKTIPFGFVWLIYAILYGVVLSLVFIPLSFLFVMMGKLGIWIMAILLAIIHLTFLFANIMATSAFSKDFSYKGVFNFFRYLAFIPNVFLPMFLVGFAYELTIIALRFTLKAIVPAIQPQILSLQPEFQFALLIIALILFGYFLTTLVLAAHCTYAEIAYDKIGNSEDNDNDKKGTKSDSSFNDVVDIDYNNYMRNKDEN